MQGQFHTHKYIGVMRQFQAGVEPQTTQRAIPLPAEAGSPLARLSVASDRGGITPPQEVVLRAAARTHHRTGIPISTHTWSPDRVGEQQVRMLEEEGAPLHRVYIGHNNDDTDLGYLLGLLHKSVWLGMDRYPGGRVPGTPDWEQRTALVKQLMDAGYTHRLMLSHDYSVPKARYGAAVQEERRGPTRMATTSFEPPHASRQGIPDAGSLRISWAIPAPWGTDRATTPVAPPPHFPARFPRDLACPRTRRRCRSACWPRVYLFLVRLPQVAGACRPTQPWCGAPTTA